MVANLFLFPVQNFEPIRIGFTKFKGGFFAIAVPIMYQFRTLMCFFSHNRQFKCFKQYQQDIQRFEIYHMFRAFIGPSLPQISSFWIVYFCMSFANSAIEHSVSSASRSFAKKNWFACQKWKNIYYYDQLIDHGDKIRSPVIVLLV